MNLLESNLWLLPKFFFLLDHAAKKHHHSFGERVKRGFLWWGGWRGYLSGYLIKRKIPVLQRMWRYFLKELGLRGMKTKESWHEWPCSLLRQNAVVGSHRMLQLCSTDVYKYLLLEFTCTLWWGPGRRLLAWLQIQEGTVGIDSFFWAQHHRLPTLPTRRQSTSHSTWDNLATKQNMKFCNTSQPWQENKALSKSDTENEVYSNFLI